jgi:hypothetical protein
MPDETAASRSGTISAARSILRAGMLCILKTLST